jgi:4-carboxymuconolactone decarboxylase
MADIAGIIRRLDSFDPAEFSFSRSIALYSAAVATAERQLMHKAAQIAGRHQVTSGHLYEVVLQSYLFLGFPRMLIAAEVLSQSAPRAAQEITEAALSDGDLSEWRERGTQLCRRVYGDAFEPLRDRVAPIAPEIFDWMIFEGYGKVLSRPGLDIIDRELSIVAFLMVENRPIQLHSHMRGALNVGATEVQLRLVVDDLGENIGDGYRSALEILPRLGGK